MTIAVFGVDALDPEIVDHTSHPHLTLSKFKPIDTILSSNGEPSTHELWPTIITGLRPETHGLTLDDGVAWENPVLQIGSKVSNYVLPDSMQTRIGALLLNRTSNDAFRAPTSYYREHGLTTIFDQHEAKPIGIPNYVVSSDMEDREHQLRRDMGNLFERDPESKGGHVSADPIAFYEQCMEMAMIRVARIRRALRSREYDLVFGYTSGLDLIGHISYDQTAMQERAYDEMNDLAGEICGDIGEDDILIIISDHGLQDGLHTDEAMIASTEPDLLVDISSVLDVRKALERELNRRDHTPAPPTSETEISDSSEVREQLEDLGYI